MHDGYQKIAENFTFPEMVLNFLNFHVSGAIFTLAAGLFLLIFRQSRSSTNCNQSQVFCFAPVESTYVTAASLYMSVIPGRALILGHFFALNIKYASS